jgi:hypothetical protein
MDSPGSTLWLLLHLALEQQDFLGGNSSLVTSGAAAAAAADTTLLLQLPEAQHADFTAWTNVVPIVLQVPVDLHGLEHDPASSLLLLQQAGWMLILP